MANISVNLSSDIINTIFKQPADTDTLADSVAYFFRTEDTFNALHNNFIDLSLTGGHLHSTFADGAYSNNDGVVLANPAATKGTATATNLEDYYPQHFRITAAGLLNYSYTITDNNVSFIGTGSTINSVAIQTLLPTYSPDYYPLLGNWTDTMTGNMIIAGDGALSGTISTLGIKADKLLESSLLTGSFSVSGNRLNIQQNLGTVNISGTATSFVQKFTDGSSLSMTDIALPVTSSTIINSDLFANEKNFAGNDVVNLTLGATLSTPITFALGAGNDKISIKGGGNSVLINAGSGNDTITLGDDGHKIDGGTGTDVALLSGAKAAYTITSTTDGYSVLAKASGATDTLTGIERLQFSDATMALDINGIAGQAYRLYQAAFNRVPDAAGLGYWISAMDKGMALNDVAALFVGSKEFTDLYGSNPSNNDFLNSMYQNVLHRAGDAAGFAFWIGHLNAGDVTRSQMLAYFGESAENQSALIGTIGNGFTYTPWG